VNLSDLVIVVRASTRDFEKGMAKTRQEIAKTQTTAQRMSTVGGAMASVGKAATLGITLPVIAAGVVAVKMAGDYEQVMNQVQAAGKVGASGMKELDALAMKMGADTIFSSKEAAQAMLELAKGGMGPAEIAAGGLKAALDLAAAGDLELGQAAMTTVQTMGMFNLKAEDAGAIAAALAGGANASTASVEDLALALSQVGPGAMNAGLSLQDTVGTIAAFANNGIRGSDAGTSLKTMLTRLVPSTDKAAKMMKQLGLDFTDAQGNILPITEVAQQLQDKLGGLSQEQKTLALNTLFGSDATRAATVLMKEGAGGVQKYIDAASDQNAATDMARARTKGLNGQLEQLKGSLETLAITFGKILIPNVQKGAKWLTGLLNKFVALDDGTKKTIITLALIGATVGPVLIVIGKMAQGMSALINVTKAFGKTPGAIKSGAGAIKGTAAALARVYQGFKDPKIAESAFSGKAGSLGGLIKKLVTPQTYKDAASKGKDIAGSLVKGIGSGLSKAGGALRSSVSTVLGKAASGLKVGVRVGTSVLSTAAGVTKDTAAWIANTAAKAANTVVTGLQTAAQWALNAAMAVNPIVWIIVGIVALIAIFIVLWKRCEWFRNFWKALWRGIVQVATAVWKAIGPTVIGAAKALWGGLKAVFAAIGRVLHKAWDVLLVVTKKVWPLVMLHVKIAVLYIKNIIWGIKLAVAVVRAVWNGIKTVTAAIWRAIQWVVRREVAGVMRVVHTVQRVIGVVRKAWHKVREITSSIWNGLKGVIKGVVDWIWKQITAILDKLKGAYERVKKWLGLGGDQTVSTAGGKGFNPRAKHARGAYIPATTGGVPFVGGEGGEGEWVVPNSKVKTFVEAMGKGGGGGVSVVINIANVNGTDRQAAEKLARMAGDRLMAGVLRQMVGQNA